MRAALVLCLLALTACGRAGPASYQGYAEGEFVRVAAPFAGELAVLAVGRGDTVAAGDLLFQLEQENEAAALRETKQRLAAAEARLANLRKGRRPEEVEALTAQRTQVQAALRLSETRLIREAGLANKGFVAADRLDQLRAARDADRARLNEIEAQLRLARQGARSDEIRAAAAEVAAARAAVAQAQWRLDQKSVRTPVAGRVHDTYYVTGEWVNAGSPVVALLPPANLKVRFFVPEAIVGTLKPGQRVSLHCDGCGKPFPAHISYISPQAEYTPPVIYSKENRSKLVFLVEARPETTDAEKLHPGQPVDVVLQ
ncbi:HlyD family secretion protein [Thiobacter aerophilum]|uniref:HlyD family efflux transporter periplasmic adaptor subunit n=1 Tax=Thiobacter aerophilum TaxID=3121275 RepID=A0ABV0EH59_9BURK